MGGGLRTALDFERRFPKPSRWNSRGGPAGLSSGGTRSAEGDGELRDTGLHPAGPPPAPWSPAKPTVAGSVPTLPRRSCWP